MAQWLVKYEGEITSDLWGKVYNICRVLMFQMSRMERFPSCFHQFFRIIQINGLIFCLSSDYTRPWKEKGEGWRRDGGGMEEGRRREWRGGRKSGGGGGWMYSRLSELNYRYNNPRLTWWMKDTRADRTDTVRGGIQGLEGDPGKYALQEEQSYRTKWTGGKKRLQAVQGRYGCKDCKIVEDGGGMLGTRWSIVRVFSWIPFCWNSAK